MTPTTTATWLGSHVLPAMIRKFHDAREEARSEVSMRGTGSARREFLRVDDLANQATARGVAAPVAS